jgi:hypothetical protein
MYRLALAGLVLVFAVLALTAPAASLAATHPSYQPKKGRACRAGYAKQVRHVRKHGRRVREVWCVHKTPSRPQPLPTITSAAADFMGGYFDVSASIFYGSGTQLVGQPVMFTITDATTGQTVATFPGTSNAYATCTITYTVDAQANVQTFTGQAVAPYQACALGTVSMPASDVALLSASFAGTPTYASSTSSTTAL